MNYDNYCQSSPFPNVTWWFKFFVGLHHWWEFGGETQVINPRTGHRPCMVSCRPSFQMLDIGPWHQYHKILYHKLRSNILILNQIVSETDCWELLVAMDILTIDGSPLRWRCDYLGWSRMRMWGLLCIQVLRSTMPSFQAVGRRLSSAAEVLGSTWAPLDQLQSTFDEVLVRLGCCDYEKMGRTICTEQRRWEGGPWRGPTKTIHQPLEDFEDQALALPWAHPTTASQSRGRTATATFSCRSVAWHDTKGICCRCLIIVIVGLWEGGVGWMMNGFLLKTRCVWLLIPFMIAVRGETGETYHWQT